MVEAGLDAVVLGAAGVDDPLSMPGLGGDAGLFFFEEVEGYGAVVVGFEQLAPFVVEPCESGALAGDLACVERGGEFDVL